MARRNEGMIEMADLKKYKRLVARKSYAVLLGALKSGIDILEKAEKNLDKGKITGAQGLDGRSFEELYDLAKDQDVPGRSKMTKSELKRELKKRLYN